MIGVRPCIVILDNDVPISVNTNDSRIADRCITGCRLDCKLDKAKSLATRERKHFRAKRCHCDERCPIRNAVPAVPPKETKMRNVGKAPTMAVWVICLVLYIVALIATFGLVKIDMQVATWSWIIGFGLLLVACRVRGL